MGNVYFSMPKQLVLDIVREAPVPNFVETGTYKGGTSFWAATVFKNVYTIEIDPFISKETSERPDCPSNIKFFVGNSKDVLPQIVKGLIGQTFFWLDGHWCWGAGGKDMECPLLEEIEAIKMSKDPIIFIDDARCFLGPLPPPHNAEDWPRIDEIFALLKLNFPFHHTTILDDVIVCFPEQLKAVMDREWVENFGNRFAPKQEDSIRTLVSKTIKRIIKK